MWKELIKNEIWYTENFIKESSVDVILEKIKQAETKVLDGNEQPHIISKSYYNYNHVKFNIHDDSTIIVQILNRLNEILGDIYKCFLVNIKHASYAHIRGVRIL